MHIDANSAAAALAQLGYDRKICFGFDEPPPGMMRTPVKLDFPGGGTLRSLIERLLPPDYRYSLSTQEHVIMIRSAAPRASVLDERIAEFRIPETPLLFANATLQNYLNATLHPSEGIAGSILGDITANPVAPIDERGRTVRELLNFIVGRSAAGAVWISEPCSRDDFGKGGHTRWRVFSYTSPRDWVASQFVVLLR
jgi:hypothetical protein